MCSWSSALPFGKRLQSYGEFFKLPKLFRLFFRCRPEASFRRALRGLFLKSECKGRHFRRTHQTNQRKISVKISFTAKPQRLESRHFSKRLCTPRIIHVADTAQTWYNAWNRIGQKNGVPASPAMSAPLDIESEKSVKKGETAEGRLENCLPLYIYEVRCCCRTLERSLLNKYV